MSCSLCPSSTASHIPPRFAYYPNGLPKHATSLRDLSALYALLPTRRPAISFISAIYSLAHPPLTTRLPSLRHQPLPLFSFSNPKPFLLLKPWLCYKTLILISFSIFVMCYFLYSLSSSYRYFLYPTTSSFSLPLIASSITLSFLSILNSLFYF